MVGYGDTHDQVVVQSDTIGWTVIISVRMLSYRTIAGSGGPGHYCQCSAQMLSILLTSIKSVRFLSRTLTFHAETDPDYHFPTFVELRLSYRHSNSRFLRHCAWRACTNVSRPFVFLVPTYFSIAKHSLMQCDFSSVVYSFGFQTLVFFSNDRSTIDLTRCNKIATERFNSKWQVYWEALWLIESPTCLSKCTLPFLGICRFYY